LSGDDELTVVRRSQLHRTYRDFIRGEIEAIEHFKQRSLASIDASANTLTETLNTLIAMKIKTLSRDLELAKHSARTFNLQTMSEQLEPGRTETSIFIKNILDKNTNLKRLKTYASNYEETEYEEQLQKFATFQLKCPTDLMFELSRTPEEYKDWLLVLKARKEEELKKQERRLTRLTGTGSGWSVSGAPTLDAFTFRASCDIWITGLGLGTGNSTGGTASIQDIEIRGGRGTRSDLLYRHPTTVTTSWDGAEDNKFMKVQFTEPVRLPKDVDYCVRVCYNSGGSIWSSNGTQTTSFEGVTFTYGSASFEGGDNDNGSSATAGPARDIYLAFAAVEL
jgi:hypothetical protein